MAQTKSFKSESWTLLILGLPLIGSQVAQFAVHTTDTLMLGWYSVIALGQVTLGGQIYFLLYVLGSGFAWALLPIVASAWENKDVTQVRRVTRMGLWLSSAFAALTMVPMWFASPLLQMMGQTAELADGAQTYLRIAGWGMWPTLMVLVLRSYLSALEHTAVVLWISLAVLAVNAAVNYVLIFGYFGAPELGLKGAAIASLAVAICSMIGFVAYIQYHFANHDLFARFWRVDMDAIRQVIALAIPIAATALAESGLFAASALMMGAMGTIEIASHGIVLQWAALTFMIHMGLSQAATVRAGQAFAHKDTDELRKVGIASMGMSAFISAVVICIFIAIPTTLIGAFLDQTDPLAPQILTLGTSLILIAAAFQFVDGAQVMALGLLRGLQDTKVPMVIATISYWLIGLPIGYILGFHTALGAQGIWCGLVSGLALTAILLWIRYQKLLSQGFQSA
ncbi:MAG: MATE family efflux transporter, partial [Planktomarina sp.]